MTADVEARAIEQLLYREARLLDQRRWSEWDALFAPDGLYWVPLDDEQTSWKDHASLFCENAMMRDVRMRRVEGSRAWSQQPPSKTARLIGNIELIEHTEEHAVVASTFHLLESRMRGEQRYFAGTYRHDLVRGEEWMIKLKRVDLINSDAAHECLEIFF